MKRTILLLMLAPLLLCSCRPSSKTETSGCPSTSRTLKQVSRDDQRGFLKGYSGDWRGDTDKSQGLPPPPIEKPFPADARTVELVKPEQLKSGNVSLAAIINQRRTRREYTQESLSNEELSFLLWSTQGISKVEKDAAGRVAYHFRTVPSGGARHPFETYLVINRVEGIRPGIYRYLPVEHKLLHIREDADRAKTVTAACYGQKQAGEAAALFIWSTIAYRTEWAYGYLAPKLIAVDAGHVCENLYLAAESIGAGACAILGYDQASMDRLIQVDGKDEFTIYLASVGKIRREDTNRAALPSPEPNR